MSLQATDRLNTWETMLTMAGICSGAVTLTADALVVSAGTGLVFYERNADLY